jgi:hypothetical protein
LGLLNSSASDNASPVAFDAIGQTDFAPTFRAGRNDRPLILFASHSSKNLRRVASNPPGNHTVLGGSFFSK